LSESTSDVSTLQLKTNYDMSNIQMLTSNHHSTNSKTVTLVCLCHRAV